MNRGYGMLAAAIVNQAVKDWEEGDEDMKAECERFFRSDWYQEIRELVPAVIPGNMMRRLTYDRT